MSFFRLKKRYFMEYVKRTIYCPNCGRKVGTYDGRGTMNIVCRCSKCMKRVIYYPATEKREIKKLPARETSSGMTFF
nr:MAG TPA: cysteine-rich protein [Bacteriophage sp.]